MNDERKVAVGLGLAGSRRCGRGTARRRPSAASGPAVAARRAGGRGRSTARRGQHGLDQLVGQPRGVEVEQPGAATSSATARVRVDDGHRRLPVPASRLAGGAVASVGGEVLGHQHDLTDPAACRPPGQGRHLVQDVAHGPRPLFAPERRDGAEAADAVAALGHLHIGPGCAGRRAGELQEVEGAAGEGRFGADRMAQAARAGPRVTGTGEVPPSRAVRARRIRPPGRPRAALGQLVAVALGHAAGDHQAGSRPAGVGQFQHGVDRLLAGRLDEGTGVHHDQVGLLRGRRRAGSRRRPDGRPACPSRPGSSGTRGSAASTGRCPCDALSLADVRRRARMGAPSSHVSARRSAGPVAGPSAGWSAEREGFEPSDRVPPVNSLAVSPIRPLSHLSRRRRHASDR